MDISQVLFLSIIEGVTEFLPVSSTGHLILGSALLQINQNEIVKSFQIFIQLGAIMAIVFLYRDKLSKNIRIWKNILVAFIPTALIGLVFYGIIKDYLLGNSFITVLALLIGGIVMIGLEMLHKERSDQAQKIEQLTLKQSALIGLCQSLSVIPGVSRAAASILGGMFLGAKRQTAVEFSFLLAIPTMLGATTLDLLQTGTGFSREEWGLFGVGFVTSFATALIVVKWFVKYVQNNNFFWFGIYRIIAAVLFYLIIGF